MKALFRQVILVVQQTFAGTLKMVTLKAKAKNFYQVSLYRNALYLMINTVVLALTGFLFWLVAARFHSAEAVGLSSATVSAMALLALFSTLGLDFGLIKFLPMFERFERKSVEMVNSCFTIGALISMTLSLVFVGGLKLWSPALLPIQQNSVYYILFVISTIATTLMSFLRQTFIAKRRSQFVLLVQGLLFGLLRFIPLVALAPFFHNFGICGSWGITLLSAVAIGIFLLLPRAQIDYHPFPTIRKGWTNEMMRFSIGNYITNAFWAIPGFVLPLMVINILGPSQSAYFYIGWSISSILFAIPMAISHSLFAEGSYDEEKLRDHVMKSFKLTLVVLVPAIVLVVFLGDKVLVLFGKAYSENALMLLRILAISALPMSLVSIYFGMKRVEMKMRRVIGLTALIALATLGLSYFSLPRIGILGVGISWFVSQSVAAVLVIVFLLREHWQSNLSKV